MAALAEGEVVPSNPLRDALRARFAASEAESTSAADDQVASFPPTHEEDDDDRPGVLVTNESGIHCAGLRALVRPLLSGGFCNVYVCVPQSENTQTVTSFAKQKTIEVCEVDFEGVKAFEVSGAPADCVSLGLSGHLFSKKSSLVICGVSKGCNCGFQIFSSASVAGARQALMCGVPSIVLSLDWKDKENQEDEFIAAVDFCLPLIRSAISDTQDKQILSGHFLNINLPTPFSEHKGFRITKQGTSRQTANWQAMPPPKCAFGIGLCKQNALGARVAGLGLAASAVAAARRKANSSLKNEEIESIAGPANGSLGSISRKKLFFQMEVMGIVNDGDDSSDDFGALQAGFVSVTPIGAANTLDEESLCRVTDWVAESCQVDTTHLL